jgi:hypothetical protein
MFGGVEVAIQAPRRWQICLDWVINQSGGNTLEITSEVTSGDHLDRHTLFWAVCS